MRQSSSGFAASFITFLLGSISLLLLAIALAGCTPSDAARTPEYSVAHHIDKEADGLPAQIAPAASIRHQSDDPAEPFSPNYGSRPLNTIRMSRAEEEAIIAQAIAAHEMRRP